MTKNNNNSNFNNQSDLNNSDDNSNVENSSTEDLNNDVLENEVDQKDLKIKELEAKILRLAADLDNTNKRAKLELENANKYGTTKIIREMLGIYDILQTALSHVDKENLKLHKEFEDLFNGLNMSNAELLKIMEMNNIKKIDPKSGDKFDHNFHEAISRITHDELDIGMIIQTVRPGYMIHDRLLRAAMVVVSSGKN